MFALGRRLPAALARPLFGDRLGCSPSPATDDPMWLEWESTYVRFYESQQRTGIGRRVNEAGYRVLRLIPLDGLPVLEIGPGFLPHAGQWVGTPAHYTLVDVQSQMLAEARSRLSELGVPQDEVLVDRDGPPLSELVEGPFDLIVCFYAFEHLREFPAYLADLRRLLLPGGRLVGAIPCEGGCAWGLGRALTSRRWLLNNTNIDPDRLICWEHPGFADDILNELGRQMTRRHLSFWPLGLPNIDVNLIARFVYVEGN